jgi:hypothetical protein
MATCTNLEMSNTGAIKVTTLTVWSVGNEPMQKVVHHRLLEIHHALQAIGCQSARLEGVVPTVEVK